MIFAWPDLVPLSIFAVGAGAALTSIRNTRAQMRELERRRSVLQEGLNAQLAATAHFQQALTRVDTQLAEFSRGTWRGAITGRLPINDKYEANQRAWQLLYSYLSPAQVDQLWRTKRFDLVSPSGRHYRIRCTKGSHNVTWFNPRTRKVHASYCVVPRQISIPAPDHYLTQAMMLMINEKHFLKTAYVRYPVPGSMTYPADIDNGVY